jgi:hypothetical protein
MFRSLSELTRSGWWNCAGWSFCHLAHGDTSTTDQIVDGKERPTLARCRDARDRDHISHESHRDGRSLPSPLPAALGGA